MGLVRISPKPGVNTQLTQAANENGIFAANLIRHRFGLIEKLAGWLRLVLHSSDVAAGYIRKLHTWEDLSNNKNLLLGTDGGPQLIVNDTLYDFQLVSKGANATTDTSLQFANFSSTNTSTTVTVGVPTSFNAAVGQLFTLLMPVSIGNRILVTGSEFSITSIAVGSFTFTMPLAATATETDAVGIPLFGFTANSFDATVTFKNHGLIVGSTFHVDKTTTETVDFIFIQIPDGSDFTVKAPVTANTFTISISGYTTPSQPPTSNSNIYEGTNQDSSGAFIFGLVIAFGLVINPTGSSASQFWYADNLGQNGVMVYSGSPLLVYLATGAQPAPGSTPPLAVVGANVPATAPQANNGMFTAMPQAQIIMMGTEATLGSGVIDPLLLRFSDAGTYDSWTAAVTNQAGSYRLSRGSRIVGGIQAPQTTLIFTDTDAWSMSYIGPPLVYGFTILGANCGLAAPHAVVCLGQVTYWQGQNSFWSLVGGRVMPLACTVWDYIFRDLDVDNINKCHAGVSSSTNEVYFFFTSLTDKPAAPTNLLQFTQRFEETLAWVKTGLTSVVDGFSAPDSSATAEKLAEDVTNGHHYVFQELTKANRNIEYTLTVYCHNSSTRNLVIQIYGTNGAASAIFNSVTGAAGYSGVTGTDVTLVTSGSTLDTLATALNGWRRYYLTVTTDATATLGVAIANANSLVAGGDVYAGTLNLGVVIWGAQLNLGADLLAYDAVALGTTNEPTRYVKYNTVENLWDTGVWPGANCRTAWTDISIFGPPMGGDMNWRIQQHETGYDDDTVPMAGAYVETGYGALQDGSKIALVDECEPDLKWFGQDGGMDVTLKGVNYAGGPVTMYGPYSVTPTTQFFSLRVRHKLIAVKYAWAALAGFSARLGSTAFRVKSTGSRP